MKFNNDIEIIFENAKDKYIEDIRHTLRKQEFLPVYDVREYIADKFLFTIRLKSNLKIIGFIFLKEAVIYNRTASLLKDGDYIIDICLKLKYRSCGKNYSSKALNVLLENKYINEKEVKRYVGLVNCGNTLALRMLKKTNLVKLSEYTIFDGKFCIFVKEV